MIEIITQTLIYVVIYRLLSISRLPLYDEKNINKIYKKASCIYETESYKP